MIQIGLQQIFERPLICNLGATDINGSSRINYANYNADTMSEMNFSTFLYDIQWKRESKQRDNAIMKTRLYVVG